MREHVKPEIAMEILSMCMAIATSNKDEKFIEEISRLKDRVYIGDKQAIEEVIVKYGERVRKTLEDNNE